MPAQWHTPVTFTAGYVVTSADLNEQLRDNMLAINGFLGHPDGTIRSFTSGGVLFGNGTGTVGVTAALAKGMLVVGSGVGTLAVGTNSTYLIADSSETLGVRWGSPTVIGSIEDIMKYS